MKRYYLVGGGRGDGPEPLEESTTGKYCMYRDAHDWGDRVALAIIAERRAGIAFNAAAIERQVTPEELAELGRAYSAACHAVDDLFSPENR